MYSFTNLSVKFDHVIAACNRSCDFCTSIGVAGVIADKEEYYLLKGLIRTHRRRCFDDPSGFVQYGKVEKVDRLCMCEACWNKFLHILRFDGLIRVGEAKVLECEFTFRRYTSLHNREYPCECCRALIPGSTLYWRIGHHRTFCMDCHKQFALLLGNAFSY
jgi:hypothetical protein